MRGVCAIVLDGDGAFIAFCALGKKQLTFITEVKVPAMYSGSEMTAYLRENLEVLDQKIREVEKEYSLKVEKVFVQLPWGASSERIAEEIITLKRRKRITSGDISFAKKCFEDKFLDWDDLRVHNIAINYKVEGVDYSSPPLGVWARRIELRSLLVWIKDKIHKEAENIFDNFDRNFGGFIASSVGVFSASFNKTEKPVVIADIAYNKTHFLVRKKNNFSLLKEFDFGLKKIIEEVGRGFLLSFCLAEEVFYRYFSFKEMPYFKEVTIKNEKGYIKLSTQAFNTFIKNYIKSEIHFMLQQIKNNTNDKDSAISFIGRLNTKEGFYGFLKDFIACSVSFPIQKSIASSSFGCLRYGISNFLENDYKKNDSFLQHIRGVYREYF